MSAKGYKCPQAFTCWSIGDNFDWRSCPLSACVKCPRRIKEETAAKPNLESVALPLEGDKNKNPTKPKE